MHSKKIGTVLNVGLIHRFLFRLINPGALIGESQMRVKLFFDETDIAAALNARFFDLRKIVGMCAEAHVFVQVMR